MGWMLRAIYFEATQIRVSFYEVLVSIQETSIVAPASYGYFTSIHRFGDPAVIRWADWLRGEF
jgi:hypothetical protein